MRDAVCFILCGLAVLAAATASGQDPDDGPLLDGLRRRGLFELAEKHCADALTRSDLSERRRAELTIELSRTLAQHALSAPADEAPRLWQQATAVVDALAQRQPNNPMLLLVRLQGVLAVAARGEAAAEDAAGSGNPQALAAARELLRKAISALEQLAGDVSRQLRRPAARDAGALTNAQLQSLEMNLRCQLAKALRNQALCYPPASADRINALALAGEQLAPIVRDEPRTPLGWSAALEHIACLRLLGELPTAQRKLAHYDQSKPPAAVAQQLRAERVRLALARGNIEEALSEAGRKGLTTPGPAAELARLEALLAAWRQATEQQQTDKAARWQRQAVEQVRSIEQSGDVPTARQAETLLARTMANSTLPQTTETLGQAAASYYRSGHLEQAVEAYDRAGDKAREEKLFEHAFDYALAAATIEKERKNYRAALARYQALAAGSPGAPKAAAAHLLAIYCAAQLAQADQPPNLDQYEVLLRDHVAAWPDDPTAAQAWLWLGRLAEHQRDWPQAIEALEHVKPGDRHFAEAVETIGRAYETWLAEMHEQGESGQRRADQALSYFESLAPKQGQGHNDATRAATLAAARIWLKEITTGALPAERLLAAALEHDDHAPESWKQAATLWLVPALAAQGKTADALALERRIAEQRPTDLPALFQALSEVRKRADGAARRPLAEVELVVEDRLLTRRDPLDPAWQRALRRERAGALAALGRRGQAVDELEALAREFPDDGQTQEALAALLAGGQGPDLPAALARWGEVAARSRPGTPRWFRASYEVARLQFKLGQVANARATIAAVAERSADFGGPGLKRHFDALAAELEQPGRPAAREQ